MLIKRHLRVRLTVSKRFKMLKKQRNNCFIVQEVTAIWCNCILPILHKIERKFKVGNSNVINYIFWLIEFRLGEPRAKYKMYLWMHIIYYLHIMNILQFPVCIKRCKNLPCELAIPIKKLIMQNVIFNESSN